MLKAKSLGFYVFLLLSYISSCSTNDILGCGGFVKSHASIDFSKIEIGLYTRDGSLKEKTECAPTNGYYFLPLYEKGEYVLKVHPPAGWSFEPSQVELDIDGETDQCSIGQDINFAFNGFGITGKVITAGQISGPSGIDVQLVHEKGETRNTVTTSGGDFHFTPVIPGKYVVKASHPRWKLEPAQTAVQVKEGNTALPVGVLAVKGYDVSGSIISFGSPLDGVYVLLYSKEEKPKFRVEGCKTALLQGVPDAPICFSVTDSNGEFVFGLVPAGEYRLLAMSKSPGQNFLTYNIEPDSVPFSVLHDGLYIRNAFEVTGFSVGGSAVVSAGGGGVSGARVSLAGRPVATTDARGQFTLTGLKPGEYVLSLQHEHCRWDDLQVSVSPGGVASPPSAAVSRWRVCGSLTPPESRTVQLRGPEDEDVTAAADGSWCLFLRPGSYSARVSVTEQEQRDGLQFYPEARSVRVGGAAVEGVSFSQVRARVQGSVLCSTHCPGLRVALRPLAADGTYSGPPRYADVVDGRYSFEEVSPGSVEVSAAERGGRARLCWQQAARNLAVAHDLPPVPAFTLTGLALVLTATHDMEVEYSSGAVSGVLRAAAGSARVCVPPAERYTLTARGCHRVAPPSADVDMRGDDVPSVTFEATAHASSIVISSPDPARDVRLKLTSDSGTEYVDLSPEPQGEDFLYTHTMYLAEGAAVSVRVQSSSLLVGGGAEMLAVGGADCGRVLWARAVRAALVAGRLEPPVEGAVVTLQGGDATLSQTTAADGVYSFGPLDASVQYAVSVEKESYAFGERGPDGVIPAHRLAEIRVLLVDDAAETRLEGALVSVSGGSFRLNALSAGGRVTARSLAPASYYVKPHMKEYRFEPPHGLLHVTDGDEHEVTFRGVRVAWSAVGRAISVGGVGVAGLALRAAASRPDCDAQDAVCDHDGYFRIRGLVPGCSYSLQLKDSSDAARLAETPPVIEMQRRDAEDLRVVVGPRAAPSDAAVLVRAPLEHYKTLRLTLFTETSLAHVYTTKLDPAGYSVHNNPGVMAALPRLAADNTSYILTLESSLSRATHSYDDSVHYFLSDGRFRHFDIVFDPKPRAAEQELRQWSLYCVPLLGGAAVAFLQRQRLAELLAPHAARRAPKRKPA